MNKLAERKQKLNPQTKQELNRFEKNEFALFGLMQLLLDKGIINHKDLQEYSIQGIFNGKQNRIDKPIINETETTELNPIDNKTEDNKPLSKLARMKLNRKI